jgi:hypothetical protein
MLALVFMTMATASHDDHEDHKEEPAVVPEEREEIARPATVEELKAELREMGRLADETEEPVVTGDGEVEAPDAVTVEAEEVEEKKSSKKKTRASKKLVKEAEEA